MAYEPKTEAGKKALADGADASVVEAMEKEGAIQDDDKDTEAQAVAEKAAAEAKAKEDADKAAAEEAARKAAEGGDGGEDDGDKGPNRTPQHMPMWKVKELEKAAAEKARAEARAEAEAEFNKKLADLGAKPGGATDADVDAFAAEFNLEPTVAGSMIERMTDIVSKKAGIPEIRKSFEENAERDKATKEEEGFKTEWSDKATQEALSSAAEGKQITDEVMRKVKEFAYSTTYSRYRLSDIIRLEASEIFKNAPKGSATVERGRGGAGRGQGAKPLSEMSAEEMSNLSDEDFLKASNELGAADSKFKFTKKR